MSGGGSGGGGPTSQTVQGQGISPYAQPYVQSLLTAAQNQVFNSAPGQGAGYDQSGNPSTAGNYDSSGNYVAPQVTGIKPYQPYSTNPQDYVAGFSPLQQQSYTAAANLAPASQIGTGTDFATQAGQGMLNSAGVAYGYGAQGSQYGQQGANLGISGGAQYGGLGAQYGGQGAGYGAQGASMGAAYGMNATDPNAVQAYMNPYLQATLAPALQLQQQQFGQQQMANQAQATQQGAYGGGRSAVMQGLNQQNQALAQNQLVSGAYNQAYNTANQNMQAASQLGMQGSGLGIQGSQAGMQGAGVGLQGVGTQLAGTGQGMQGAQVGLQGVAGAQAGYQGAINAANSLNALGNSQFGQQSQAAQLQNQMGTQQQANQQQVINQNVQNYAMAQQYPYQQMGFLSNMIQGLPLASTSTMGYQAPPSSVSQLSGLGLTGAAAYGLMKKEGGQIKAKKFVGGGIASGVPASQLPYMLGGLPDQQLAQKTRPPTDPATIQAALGQQAFRQQMRAPGLAAQPAPNMASPQMPVQPGLAAAPAGQTTFNAAGGGIVAFANEGLVPKPTPVEGMDLGQRTDYLKSYLGQDQAGQDYRQKLKDIEAEGISGDSNQGLFRLMQAGLGIMGGTSPYAAVNIGQGSQAAVAGHMEDVKEQKKQQLGLAKAQFEVSKMDREEQLGLLKMADANDMQLKKMAQDKDISVETLKNQIKVAQIGKEATVYAADKEARERTEGVNTIKQGLLAQGYPDNDNTNAIAYTKYKELGKPYGGVSMINAETEAVAKDPKLTSLYKEKKLLQFTGTDEQKAKIDADIATRENEIRASVRGRGPQGNMGASTAAPVAPAANPPSVVMQPGVPTYVQGRGLVYPGQQ